MKTQHRADVGSAALMLTMPWNRLTAPLVALCALGCAKELLEPSAEVRFGPGDTPTGVNAGAASHSRIDFRWQDNSSNETGFEVHRSDSGASGTFALLASTGADVTSYSDVGLSAATEYCYKVRALRTTGNKTNYSAFSIITCTTTTAPSPQLGTLQVRTTTTGVDLDGDGYDVLGHVVPPDGTVNISLLAGDYVVTLRGVAMNCDLTPATPNARTITVPGGGTAALAFDVACAPAPLLAFMGGDDFDICTIKANGADATCLTTSAGWDGNPAWSPDGSSIAFESERDGRTEIYVMNADGSNPVRLTNDTLEDCCATWSPDGTKIAFTKYTDVDDLGQTNIFVMNSDGTDAVKLPPDSASNPAWSPDGGRIAFGRPDGLYLMNPDGSGVTYLTDGDEPAWSPDGRKLAVAGVFVINADGSDRSQVTEAGNIDVMPAWSPDGRWIAVHRTFCAWVDYDGYQFVYQCSSLGITFLKVDRMDTVYEALSPGVDAAYPAWRP